MKRKANTQGVRFKYAPNSDYILVTQLNDKKRFKIKPFKNCNLLQTIEKFLDGVHAIESFSIVVDNTSKDSGYTVSISVHGNEFIDLTKGERLKGFSVDYSYNKWITVYDINHEDNMLEFIHQRTGTHIELLKESFEQSKKYKGKCNMNITKKLDLYHPNFRINPVSYSFIPIESKSDIIKTYFC